MKFFFLSKVKYQTIRYILGCPFIQQMKTALKIAAGESSSDQFKPKIRPNNGFLAVGDGGPTLTFLA